MSYAAIVTLQNKLHCTGMKESEKSGARQSQINCRSMEQSLFSTSKNVHSTTSTRRWTSYSRTTSAPPNTPRVESLVYILLQYSPFCRPFARTYSDRCWVTKRCVTSGLPKAVKTKEKPDLCGTKQADGCQQSVYIWCGIGSLRKNIATGEDPPSGTHGWHSVEGGKRALLYCTYRTR